MRHGHHLEGGQVIRQLETHNGDTVLVRYDRRIPVGGSAKILPNTFSIRDVLFGLYRSPAAANFLAFLVVVPLLDDVQAGFCRNNRKPAFAIKLLERVRQPVTDQVKDAQIGNAQRHLGASRRTIASLNSHDNIDGIPGSIFFLIRLDRDVQFLFFWVDREGNISDFE